MDIQQTIDRLYRVNIDISRLQEHTKLDAPVRLTLEDQNGKWGVNVQISADQYSNLHKQAIEKLTTERDALQAVIDAANAMLKGMGK